MQIELQHSTAQHNTAQHSTAQHSTAQPSAAQHSTAQHSLLQLSTAQRWHYTLCTHTMRACNYTVQKVLVDQQPAPALLCSRLYCSAGLHVTCRISWCCKPSLQQSSRIRQKMYGSRRSISTCASHVTQALCRALVETVTKRRAVNIPGLQCMVSHNQQ